LALIAKGVGPAYLRAAAGNVNTFSAEFQIGETGLWLDASRV